MPQLQPAFRPFQSYLVERMQKELEQREVEYLEDRMRAHKRFSTLVISMQDELFHYRSTSAAMQLLEQVQKTTDRVKAEAEEIQQFTKRWKK